jgi:predicted RNA binding protein with dsRBD fold (UPF0201 family)
MSRADGAGQGIEVRVSSKVELGESPAKVLEAIGNIFPEFPPAEKIIEPNFPLSNNPHSFSAVGVSIANLLELAANQRILDTALDSMSASLNGEHTRFRLSRQAALAGKLSFTVIGERPLGGTISIDLEGEDLDIWLEEATWHPGREEIPRNIGDDLQMFTDGEPRGWVN